MKKITTSILLVFFALSAFSQDEKVLVTYSGQDNGDISVQNLDKTGIVATNEADTLRILSFGIRSFNLENSNEAMGVGNYFNGKQLEIISNVQAGDSLLFFNIRVLNKSKVFDAEPIGFKVVE